MRSNPWSRILIALSFLSLPVQAGTPPGQETGTRVTVKLSQGSELPDPEKLVESLEAVGGEHQVRVKRRKSPEQEELTMDLWGNFVPQADVSRTLRDAFPALAGADIQVSTLDAKERPKREGEGRLEKELRGEDGATIKKVVKIIKKKEP